jgi:hypothetical protein
MKLPLELDDDLVGLLRLPDSSAGTVIPKHVRRTPANVLRRAELHGLTAVVEPLLLAGGVELPPSVVSELRFRAAAREMDHAARLEQLARIDDAFASAGVNAIALKGALLGERYYAVPSGRATSDTDLMVAERDLERAARVLERLGYIPESGPDEERFRREHHHLHLAHPAGPPLELHFHAYRGFGSVLPSEALIERRERVAPLSHGAVGVLSKPDELVYLAVHAAAHRFVRIGWLYDMRLILAQMTDDELATAAARARGWGYGRLLAFTAELLADTLGVPSGVLEKLGRLDVVRSRVVARIVGEPSSPMKRSATRFVYSVALCDSLPAAARYATSSTMSRVRGAVGAWRAR